MRYESAHVVRPDGSIWSPSSAPYRLVARNRHRLGPLVPDGPRAAPLSLRELRRGGAASRIAIVSTPRIRLAGVSGLGSSANARLTAVGLRLAGDEVDEQARRARRPSASASRARRTARARPRRRPRAAPARRAPAQFGKSDAVCPSGADPVQRQVERDAVELARRRARPPPARRARRGCGAPSAARERGRAASPGRAGSSSARRPAAPRARRRTRRGRPAASRAGAAAASS